MKIIILGAGQVGSSVAANLVGEANDITVIDTNPKCLTNLNERYDLQTVIGVASHPSVLEQAGAKDADMILAVTNSDEINMIACQVAYTLFHTPTKIARVRNTEYLSKTALFAQEALPIDVLISPEQLVTEHIERLIKYPRALQVLEFADGKVQMVAVRANYSGPLVGHRTGDVGKYLPELDYRIAILFRQDKAIIPNGKTVIEPDDELFFIGTPKHVRDLVHSLRSTKRQVKRIILAGGGNIGMRLAMKLERHFQVKLIEIDFERAQHAAEQLKNTIVLHGDATNEELLREENIDETDIFCALTHADEANIISSMLSKRLGARKVMALINRAGYVDLIQSNVIDIAISPQQATIGTLLAHIRKGDVVAVHSLRRGVAEAIEAVAHGNKDSSKVVGRMIEEVELPSGTSISALVRGDEVLLAHHDTVIEAEDHIILLVADKKQVPEIERLFQVGITFI